MTISQPRGARLLVTGLVLMALVVSVALPVSGATAATGTPAVSSGTTLPLPLEKTASLTTTTDVTKTKVSPTATGRVVTAKTTARATQSTTSPPKTAAPTTAPPTQPPATEAPKQVAAATPAKAPASVVVTAPTIVPGSFTVPAGTGIFSISSVGNVPVGGDGVVQLIVDNGWSPLFSDTYIDISWDPSMVAYQSSVIKVLNTTAAVSSDRSVRVMLGDFRRGYPQGKYPLAAITLRALREGTSTLTVSVDHVRYWSEDFSEFTDITATASGRSGVFATGALPVETQPLVTFTQNTLAPVSYPVNDIDAGFASTKQTTAVPTTSEPTPTLAETVATPPPATVVETSPSASQTVNSSYAPVSTRVQTTGSSSTTAVVVALTVLAGVALLVRRRG